MSHNNQELNIFNYNYPVFKFNQDKIKVGTFFSGVGSPEMAFRRLKENKIIKDYEFVFFSEIDKFAIKSYCAIHNKTSKDNMGDISKIDGKKLPYADIWIGGFPCQDISMAGVRKGFDFNSKTRSSLGWEMIRLLKEVDNQPKIVIFENVEAITNCKMQRTLRLFKEDLESISYTLYDNVLNALDYGIPQNRSRYFLVAIKGEYIYNFPSKIKLKKKLKDFIEEDTKKENILSEKVYFDLNEFIRNKDTRKEYKIECKNLKKKNYNFIINLYRFIDGKNVCGHDESCTYNQSKRLWSMNGYCPTLTANSSEDNSKMIIYKNSHFFVKKITPLECWRFMGFSNEDFYKAKNSGLSKRQLFKQAGNSIVVDVIYYLLKNLF